MIRKVTEQHLREVSEKPVFKVVRVEEDGRLRSLWVRGTKESPFVIEVHGKKIRAYTLTYKQNKVISDGVYGIWCNETFEAAMSQAHGNGQGKLCQIYLAFPIGEPIIPPSGWGDFGTVLYPAVILGKCIRTINLQRR